MYAKQLEHLATELFATSVEDPEGTAAKGFNRQPQGRPLPTFAVASLGKAPLVSLMDIPPPPRTRAVGQAKVSGEGSLCSYPAVFVFPRKMFKICVFLGGFT